MMIIFHDSGTMHKVEEGSFPNQEKDIVPVPKHIV